MAGKAIIGTSGWHYNHWISYFYPEGLSKENWLDHDHQFFRTVEINNSYRLPKPATFQNWRKSTPPDFTFAVKASRFSPPGWNIYFDNDQSGFAAQNASELKRLLKA